MPYTGSPPTFTAGQKTGVAAGLNSLRDFARAFTDAWTPYTPTLTASTTNPTNWTQTGYYARAGKLVVARFLLTAGASVTAGSGTYRIALPANARTDVPMPTGSAYMYDASAGAIAVTPYFTLASTYLGLRYPATWPSGAAIDLSHNAPFAWAANDQISGQIIYEAA